MLKTEIKTELTIESLHLISHPESKVLCGFMKDGKSDGLFLRDFRRHMAWTVPSFIFPDSRTIRK